MSARVGLPAWNALVSSAHLPSPIEFLTDSRLRASGVQVWLKREDLIHDYIPGNKWRKLKSNLHQAITDDQNLILTFGGAYSNHIRATAAAANACGISSIGVIRGEERLPLNRSLAFAVDQGMRLSYMDRATYRRKADPSVINELRQEYGKFYLLPEGGTNELAAVGCSEILSQIDAEFDIVCCPCGTGGTFAGITASLSAGQYAIGFSALKGGDFLEDDVTALHQRAFGRNFPDWRIETGYHFGGFAKRSADLDRFISEFRRMHGLTLDWVYVAKMMYGLYSLVEQGGIPRGSKVLAIITGPPEPA